MDKDWVTRTWMRINIIESVQVFTEQMKKKKKEKEEGEEKEDEEDDDNDDDVSHIDRGTDRILGRSLLVLHLDRTRVCCREPVHIACCRPSLRTSGMNEPALNRSRQP